MPYVHSRRVGQWPDRLSYKEDAGGSTPPSSTVAEVEVDDTPGRGPGRSRFESGRHPTTITAGDLAISGVSYALRAGSIPAPATTTRNAGPIAQLEA